MLPSPSSGNTSPYITGNGVDRPAVTTTSPESAIVVFWMGELLLEDDHIMSPLPPELPPLKAGECERDQHVSESKAAESIVSIDSIGTPAPSAAASVLPPVL